MGEWFHSAFKKFGEVSWQGWLVFAVLIVLGIGLLTLTRNQKKWTSKMLAMGALCVALSFVLGMIRLFKMPQGGSVTPGAMLPMMLFSYVYGVGPGVLVGVVYGLLDFIQSSAVIVNVWSFALDYLVGFGCVCLAGLFNKEAQASWGLYAGIAVACLGRFIASVASGVLFYAEYAQGTGMSPMVYSISYNGSYMLPEMLICLVIALLVGKRLAREMKKA